MLAIPKTMDNDVFGTDYCIGFSTAVTRSVEFMHALRTPTGFHERIAVVELFGRNCGETTLVSAYLADVDRAIIAEVPFDVERLAGCWSRTAAQPQQLRHGGHLRRGRRRRRPRSGVRPGGRLRAPQAGGHRPDRPARRCGELTGVDIVNQQLAYLMRAGPPDFARPDGGPDLRHPGRRSARAGHQRADGGLAERALHHRAGGDLHPGRASAWTWTSSTTSTQYRPRVRHVAGKPMFLY